MRLDPPTELSISPRRWARPRRSPAPIARESRALLSHGHETSSKCAGRAQRRTPCLPGKSTGRFHPAAVQRARRSERRIRRTPDRRRGLEIASRNWRAHTGLVSRCTSAPGSSGRVRLLILSIQSPRGRACAGHDRCEVLVFGFPAHAVHARPSTCRSCTPDARAPQSMSQPRSGGTPRC